MPFVVVRTGKPGAPEPWPGRAATDPAVVAAQAGQGRAIGQVAA